MSLQTPDTHQQLAYLPTTALRMPALPKQCHEGGENGGQGGENGGQGGGVHGEL